MTGAWVLVSFFVLVYALARATVALQHWGNRRAVERDREEWL